MVLLARTTFQQRKLEVTARRCTLDVQRTSHVSTLHLLTSRRGLKLKRKVTDADRKPQLQLTNRKCHEGKVVHRSHTPPTQVSSTTGTGLSRDQQPKSVSFPNESPPMQKTENMLQKQRFHKRPRARARSASEFRTVAADNRFRTSSCSLRAAGRRHISHPVSLDCLAKT